LTKAIFSRNFTNLYYYYFFTTNFLKARCNTQIPAGFFDYGTTEFIQPSCKILQVSNNNQLILGLK